VAPIQSWRRRLQTSNASTPKLGPKRLLEVLDEFYPSVYLTMLSIIQGVALGTFVVKSSLLARDGQWSTLASLVASLLLIIYIWFEYMGAGLVFKWIPALYDSALPILIGVGECAAILVVGRPLWWLAAFAVLGILGLLEHLDMYWHIHEEAYVETRLFDWERRNQRRYMVQMVCVVGVIALALLLYSATQNGSLGRAVQFVPLVIMLVLLGFSHAAWEEGIRIYGIDRHAGRIRRAP
jgi:hypothetical protein